MKGPSERHQRARPPGKPTEGFAIELERHFGIRLHEKRMWPDAYEFETHKKTLRLYEVIVTHPLTQAKLVKLRWLRDELAAKHGWRLRVVAGAMDGKYRNINWDTGGPIVTWRSLVAATNKLDRYVSKYLTPPPQGKSE